jgi:hypothetical protein
MIDRLASLEIFDREWADRIVVIDLFDRPALNLFDAKDQNVGNSFPILPISLPPPNKSSFSHIFPVKHPTYLATYFQDMLLTSFSGYRIG